MGLESRYRIDEDSLNWSDEEAQYNIGIGKADITGPCAGIRFFGYAHLSQVGEGLEQRLFARAFIMQRAGSAMVFVNCDLGMISELVRLRVYERVQKRLGQQYPPECICLSATHSHSTPGGYSSYMLYNVIITGHSPRVMDVITNGIAEAIEKAHAALQPGWVTLSTGQLLDASTNRSVEAYELNPEPSKYGWLYPFNDRMTQLCFWNQQRELLGVLNWFAVHGTSYDVNNRFVSGDNKGYASWYAEQYFGHHVVAAFAQGNSGDISPNRRATADGRLEGEGATPRASNRIIGERQARKAIELVRGEQQLVRGGLRCQQLYVDFDENEVPAAFSSTGEVERIGPAMLGQNMIPGTKDGRGPVWFAYGSPERDIMVQLVARVTSPMDAAQRQRHDPKQPFLKLSWTTRHLVPHILPLQIFVLGQFAIVTMPFETSTVAGYRIHQDVRHILQQIGVEDLALACLSNAYAGYMTTPEEYALQYYEGASTLFGREQLNVVRHQLSRLAASMVEGQQPPSGPPAPDLADIKIFGPNLDTPWIDAAPSMQWFGYVVDDCDKQYRPGDTAEVTFWSAHPAHSQHGSSYFNVERRQGDHWEVVADDHDWSTRFYWRPYFRFFARCTCSWEIPETCPAGTYRLVHYGTWRNKSGQSQTYQGIGRPFEVDRLVPQLAETVSPGALPIFEGARPAEVLAAKAHFDTITVASGTTMIEQGAQDRSVFYVLKGKLGVWTNEIEINRIGPGELVGEVALFDKLPRSASVIAIEASTLLRLPCEGYEALRQNGNEVAHQIERLTLGLMAKRLRQIDFIMSQMAEGGPSPYAKPSDSILGRIRRLFTRPAELEEHEAWPVELEPFTVLRQAPVFAAVTDEDLREIAGWFESVSASRGEFLCTQGESGDTLYVIGAGAVDVIVSVQAEGEEQVTTLERLKAGEMFGLTSMIDGRLRAASCVAVEPTVLLALPHRQWQTCLEASNSAASGFRRATISTFSGQLRHAVQLISSFDSGASVSLDNLVRGGASLDVTRELTSE